MKPHTIMFVAILLVAGCETTPSNVKQLDHLESVGDDPRIVLMPPDIRYYLVTTGGISEPNAEWTNAAQENFAVAMVDYAESIGADLSVVHKDDLSPDEIRYETLHSAVGMTILTHHFGMTKLPSKAGAFDWSLGPEINSIARDHDAEYGLFVYYRDYQASGGRVAFAILAAAAGVGVGTGSEHGFASLVDLNTGDIVWFNVVVAGSGELRNEDGAAKAVAKLFKDIPASRASTEQ